MGNRDQFLPSTPMTDEELREITVGERRLHNDVIHLAPYEPSWPTAYAKQAQGIRAALGERVLLLEHAGSTSVPGLSAKPIIDMVMAVADSADEDAYVPPLEAIGYTLHVREPKWYEHRLIRYSRIAINLHVFSDGCEEIDRMLLFRDWLRSHPKERILYETTKQELAARTWQHVQNYADAKSEVVREILLRASQDNLFRRDV